MQSLIEPVLAHERAARLLFSDFLAWTKLPVFSEICGKLTGFPRIAGIAGICWNWWHLLGAARICEAALEFWGLPKFGWIYWPRLPGCVGIAKFFWDCWDLLELRRFAQFAEIPRICWNLLRFAGICWALLRLAGGWWDLLRFVMSFWDWQWCAVICWGGWYWLGIAGICQEWSRLAGNCWDRLGLPKFARFSGTC